AGAQIVGDSHVDGLAALVEPDHVRAVAHVHGRLGEDRGFDLRERGERGEEVAVADAALVDVAGRGAGAKEGGGGLDGPARVGWVSERGALGHADTAGETVDAVDGAAALERIGPIDPDAYVG